jgi:uncharacterized integral membrane protein
LLAYELLVIFASENYISMSGKVIIFFVLAVLLTIFTFQNQIQINIKFFHWEIADVPLVVVLLSGLIFGFLLAMMMQLPRIIKLKKELKKVVTELEKSEQIEADKDEDVNSEGVSMGSEYKGGFFNE